MQYVAEKGCDLAIVDVRMPVMDGLRATRLLRKKHPQAKVLILTMNDEITLVRHVPEAGRWATC